VIDVASAITGKDSRHAAADLRVILEKHPEVNDRIVNFRFPGRGQRIYWEKNAAGTRLQSRFSECCF